MFQSLFDASDASLEALTSNHKIPSVEPLRASPWVCASAVQKAMRRGHSELALSAAATLLKVDPTRLWRRLAGIVVEDIGLADLECVKLVMAATAGKTFRREFGGEHRVASLVVARMCEAKKCRAADDLFIVASHHHELEALRADMARVDLSEHLSRVRERGALLGASLAALHASGTRWNGQVAGRKADPTTLFAAMRSAGVEPEIVNLSEQGWRRTREALPILLPLVSLACPVEVLSVADDQFPPVVMARNGLPTYCLDRFSREGGATFSRFLKRDTRTARWLRCHVAAERRLAVLAGAVFRIEGSCTRQRVEWPCAATLRRLADSGYHGMRLPDPVAFLDMVRADLPTLDEERANVR